MAENEQPIAVQYNGVKHWLSVNLSFIPIKNVSFSGEFNNKRNTLRIKWREFLSLAEDIYDI